MLVRVAIEAMRTRFEIALADPARSAGDLRAAGEEAIECVREIEGRLNRFDRASIVSDLNRRAGREPVRVDPSMLDLLQRCIDLSAASRGAFDVTIGRLMETRGFHAVSDVRGPTAMTVGIDHLRLDGATSTVRFADPGLGLDLGGIGKGVGLDAAAEALRDADIASALLHGGTSSVVAIGAPAGEPGWRIAVADADVVVVLRDAALSVSMPTGRTDESGAGHVIDPRTGASVTSRLAAVVADDATLADAWSTAVLVDHRLAEPTNAPPGVRATLVHDGNALVTHGDVARYLDTSAMETVP